MWRRRSAGRRGIADGGAGRMIRIRQAQLDALADALAEPFRRALARRLWEYFPDVWPEPTDPALLAFVRAGLATAEARGWTSEQSLLRFLDLSVVHGRELEDSEWARTILDDPDLSPDACLDELERAAIDREREL
jgi:hypothetical protein